MFDNLKDMGKLLKQAKDMKSKMQDIQKELKKLVIKEQNKSGTIIVEITGEMDITNINIDPSLLSPSNAKNLTKELTVVLNNAINEAKQMASSQLSSVSKGLNIPGM